MKTVIKYFVVFLIFTSVISEPHAVYSQTTGEDIITNLKDADEEYYEYTKTSLINLLCNSNWSLGYDQITFYKNGIYETGVQDTYERKWKMTDEGKIIVYPVNEMNKKREFEFLNTYTLINNSKKIAYFSVEFYWSFGSSKESKKVTEKDISDITEEDITGIWVTDEQGPMGELLGFKFTENSFEFGRPGLEIPFGCWDDAEYEDVGTWRYDKTNKTIIMSRTGYENMGNIEIKLNKFFNGAFEGSIMPEYYYDEVGNSMRTFWKSECR